MPHAPANGAVALPFSLGDVPLVWFHGIVFSILGVLALAFASAHAQQIRAQKLAHDVIDKITASFTPNNNLHPRDYFDMLRTPSLTRVASLSQVLRGKHQFFASAAGLPAWRRRMTAVYYALLKLVSLIIYFLLPLSALYLALKHVPVSGTLFWCTIVGAIVAAGALFEVMALDAFYAAVILRKLWKPATDTVRKA
jgi:hypothetical protein